MSDTDTAVQVMARMAYTEPVSGEAVIRIFPPGCGRKLEAPRRERHEVRIESCRPLADALDLDVAGFALKRHATAFTEFFDVDAVRRDYYPEVARALAGWLTAESVFVFDHNGRSRPRAEAGQDGVREPVDGAHNDYTLASGPRRIGEVLALKCYDSADDGRARFTGHTGFRNPDCPDEHLPRESIEARTVVVFRD